MADTQLNSERIAMVIERASKLSHLEWLMAVIEEKAAPLRKELAELQGGADLKSAVVRVPHIEKIELPEISGPSRREVAARKRWDDMSPEQREAQGRKMAQARWGKKKRKAQDNGYWASMTAEERSAEMKRRYAMRKTANHLRRRATEQRVNGVAQ